MSDSDDTSDMDSSIAEPTINDDAKGDASLFFGIKVPAIKFWHYLVGHDKHFAAAVLVHVKANKKKFKEYTVKDILEDLKSEQHCGPPGYERTLPYKSVEHCLDVFEDIETRVFVFKEVRKSFGLCVPITIIPSNMCIEWHEAGIMSGEDYLPAIYLGKRIPIYESGVSVTNIPNNIFNVFLEEETALLHDVARECGVNVGFIPLPCYQSIYNSKLTMQPTSRHSIVIDNNL